MAHYLTTPDSSASDLRQALELARSENARLQKIIQLKDEQIRLLNFRLFGPKSEKLAPAQIPLLLQEISVMAGEVDAGSLLRPVVGAMRLKLLSGGYIQADETTMPCQTGERIGRNHRAFVDLLGYLEKQHGATSVRRLDASILRAFLFERARDRSSEYVRLLATSLRSFLRFLHVQGDIRHDLTVSASVKKTHKEDLKAAAKDIQKMLPAQRERIDGLFLQQKT